MACFGQLVVVSLLVCFSLACSRKATPEDPEIWQKIHLDFSQIDPDGRTGPPGGKVVVNYEFCVPAQEKFWKTVQKIDSTVIRQAGTSGRIGCGKGQCLIIGSTAQPKYRRVLYELASLPFVPKIEQTYWE